MGAPEAEELVAPPENDSGDGVVWEDLPAPPAWKKKRRGGTPRRGDITFVAPDGEEIKSKRQLERYLKSNPGGPAVADFDWSTGETPRRSERLSSRKRPYDFEVEATTPKRGGRKKKSVSAPAAAEKSDEELAGKEEEPVANEDAPKEQEQAEDEEAKGEAAPAPAPAPEDAPVVPESVEDKAVEIPLSCAKTETLTKSQETQPAQIGVS